MRSETARVHARVEALPFFQALHAGSLPKPAVVSFLRCLAIVHAVLEREISLVSDGRVSELASAAVPKLPMLVADLDALAVETTPSNTAAIRATLDFGAEILANADDALSLIGPLYVLEGSQAGGIVLKKAYARCLGLPEEGVSYFGCYGNATATHWKAFVARMDSIPFDDEQSKAIARSAVRCFERMETICSALVPYNEASLGHHVAAVNPEAGDHAMPQNPIEIALALRAGRSAWAKYPYLERRFGDRGRRFTSSDSCWLVALTRMPTETATKNLVWLRSVLASRGIPTIILETHLRTISQALAIEFPAEADVRERFDPFLAALDLERRAVVGGEALASAVENFDRRLRACGGFTVESAAELIASAWLDERCGLPGSLAASANWFTDAERFAPDWILEVKSLIATLDRAGGSAC